MIITKTPGVILFICHLLILLGLEFVILQVIAIFKTLRYKHMVKQRHQFHSFSFHNAKVYKQLHRGTGRLNAERHFSTRFEFKLMFLHHFFLYIPKFDMPVA